MALDLACRLSGAEAELDSASNAKSELGSVRDVIIAGAPEHIRRRLHELKRRDIQQRVAEEQARQSAERSREAASTSGDGSPEQVRYVILLSEAEQAGSQASENRRTIEQAKRDLLLFQGWEEAC